MRTDLDDPGGNTPAGGETSAWSIVSRAGGSFGNASGPTSTFGDLAGNSYTLRWTIQQRTLTASTGDVIITFNGIRQSPTRGLTKLARPCAD